MPTGVTTVVGAQTMRVGVPTSVVVPRSARRVPAPAGRFSSAGTPSTTASATRSQAIPGGCTVAAASRTPREAT